MQTRLSPVDDVRAADVLCDLREDEDVSETTRAAIEQAIQAHIADEADGELRMLTDWYVITAAVSEDVDVTNYLHVVSHSPSHSLAGLTQIAWRRMKNHVDDEP